MEPKGSITSMEAQWAALASNVRGQLRTAAGSATKTAWNPCPKGLAPQLLCLHSTRGCPCHPWQSKGRPHHTNNSASAFKWRLHAETPCSWDKLKLSKAPSDPHFGHSQDILPRAPCQRGQRALGVSAPWLHSQIVVCFHGHVAETFKFISSSQCLSILHSILKLPGISILSIYSFTCNLIFTSTANRGAYCKCQQIMYYGKLISYVIILFLGRRDC